MSAEEHAHAQAAAIAIVSPPDTREDQADGV
jgi:hypothetical protein